MALTSFTFLTELLIGFQKSWPVFLNQPTKNNKTKLNQLKLQLLLILEQRRGYGFQAPFAVENLRITL